MSFQTFVRDDVNRPLFSGVRVGAVGVSVVVCVAVGVWNALWPPKPQVPLPVEQKSHVS